MWAKQYKSCKECNSDKLKHYGNGYCRRCYKRQRYKENPESFKASEKRRYARNTERIKLLTNTYYHNNKVVIGAKLKRARELKWFSGLRETVLARDNNTCQHCSNYGNVVHHKDGNGRGSITPNNSLDNLVTLCRSCHCKIHKPRLNTGKG